MSLINIINVNHRAGDRVLFQNVSFSIQKQDRIALVGANGCGKSTLLEILMGEKSTDGQIIRQQNLHIIWLKQFIPINLLPLSPQALLRTRHRLETKYTEQYNVTAEQYEKIIGLCALTHQQCQRPLADFSGGQQNQLLLAHACVIQPDLILMDEPSNYLDLPTMIQFENMINQILKGAILIVSHDEEFIENTTHQTLFLHNQTMHHFDLRYQQAAIALQQAEDALRQRSQTQMKTITRLEKRANELKRWGRDFDNPKLSKKAKSMETRIEK